MRCRSFLLALLLFSSPAWADTTGSLIVVPPEGGGSSAFSDLTGGTNTGAAMVVGTGASLSASGSGTIAATSAVQATALAANAANCSAGSYPLGVDASGAAEGCAAVNATAVGGDLSGTVASAAVGDDSHAHTGATISGIDASDDTNLAAGVGLAYSADTFSLRFADTIAGNPSLGAEECVFSTDGSGAGAVICEGSVADAFEGLFVWPNVTGADSTQTVVTDATALGGDLSGTVGAAVVANDSHDHTGATISGLDTADTTTGTFADARVSESSVTQHEAALSIATGQLTGVNAGTDLTTDLEEETHATEHSLGGGDAITVTNLASGCTDAQVLGGTAASTGVECQADDDVPESGDFGAGVDLEADGSLSADVVGAAELADGDLGDVSVSGGVVSVDANSVALTTDTTGNYVDNVTGGAGVTVTHTPAEGSEPDVVVDLLDTDDGTGAIASQSGMEFAGSGSDELALLQGCADGEILKWDNTAADWECAEDGGGGGGTMPDRTWEWAGPNMLPAEPADGIPPIGLIAGTHWDALVAGYDASADECRSVTFQLPVELDTSGSATFRVTWSSPSATSGSVMWDVRHIGITEGETCDAALTTESAASDATQGTTGLRTITTWTETITNTGWAAGDQVCMLVCRDANGTAGTDDMAGDANVHSFSVTVGRVD